jgi:fermentation-respiration switch protein FrsA (DUF1100 family)
MKPRRLALLTLIGIAGSYVALCVVARIAYPRMLFPAPKLGAGATVPGAGTLVTLPQADGSHTDPLYTPADNGRRTVVVFHGNGETMFDNVAYAAELKRRGLGTLLVEYRGYGTTYGPPPTEAMLYEDGEVALAYLAREGIADARIALWGWSLGTGVAAELARRGHGARVVLLSPYTSIVDMGRRTLPILPVSLLLAHRLDTLAKAPSIKQPVLVVHGDADELIPPSMGATVAAALPAGRLLRVAGGHHADLFYGSGSPSPSELFDAIAKHVSE